MSTNIQVAIRIRPLMITTTEQEKKRGPQWGTQGNSIFQIDDSGHTCGDIFSFDHIFGVHKTNENIYNDIVKEFVMSSLNGLNATIFAYGQTSSGKTYTMLGDKKTAGLMSLAIENLFDVIENSLERNYLIRVSYIEIYNEKIIDLLDPNNKDVKIREAFTNITLQNIKEEIVSSREEMYDCLRVGTSNRRIASNKVNDRSSRSHTIYRITIESAQVFDFDNGNSSIQVSVLNFVDLAGSERVAQTKATGVRLKEGGHINKSLSALGLVIRQLSDGQEYVNFRDSKLTRLLQDSLGGNSKTLIIATITLASVEDTNSTLAFAQRAKAVKNKPQVNEILTEAEINNRYKSLNSQLQKKLSEQHQINEKIMEESSKQMNKLEQQIKMLQNFHQGKIKEKFDDVPKRRHTIIGFSSKKPLFSDFDKFDKSNCSNRESSSSCRSSLLFDDLVSKESCSSTFRESCSSTNALDTIIEEDPLSVSKLSTPESALRKRLSYLEKEHYELLTFTRNEANMKSEECELQLRKTQQELMDSQVQIKELRLREEDLSRRIAEFEDQQNNQSVDNCLINYPDIIGIKNQLITLHEMLSSRSFVNDDAEIEKFYSKVRSSKEIIKNVILQQVNTFDQNIELLVPNELESFYDLLNEFSLFESDIPFDLIKKMKGEGIEDLKNLIKIYESFLKKNQLIGTCLEKIKQLEERNDEFCKKEVSDSTNNKLKELEVSNEKLKLEIVNKNCENEKLKELHKVIDSTNNKLKELEVTNENLKQEIVNKDCENEKLKEELVKVYQNGNCLKDESEKNFNLKSELVEKNKLLEESEMRYKALLQERDLLQEKLNNTFCEKEVLSKKIEELGKLDLVEKEENNENFDVLMNTTSGLRPELSQKDKQISELIFENETLKVELKSFKARTKSINYKLDKSKENIEKLNLEISDRDRIITDMQEKLRCSCLENEALKDTIEILKTDLATQKHVQEEIKHILSTTQADKEKLINDLNGYKTRLLEITKKQEESERINESLKVQVRDLEYKSAELVCGKESNELKNALCSIIEHIINEQKILLAVRHSQDERDHFKDIIKDLRSTNTVLKSQVDLLRSQNTYNLEDIKDCLIRSYVIAKNYFNSERSLLNSQISDLDTTNKAYLQEIMVLRDMQQEVSNEICSRCESVKKEQLRLNNVISSQEGTLNDLKNKNTKLEKQKREYLKEIVELREKIYKEHDQKGEIAYVNLMKFYKEGYESQRKEIEKLNHELHKYKMSTNSEKKSVGIQCNIVSAEIGLRRKEEVATLKRVEELKNAQVKVVNKSCAEVQCNILSDFSTLQEKHNMVKSICRMRKEEIASLKADIKRLKEENSNYLGEIISLKAASKK